MKYLFVVALTALALSGCQRRPDLDKLIAALGGELTYKETLTWLESTSHETLLGQNAYLVRHCRLHKTDTRTVREGESVRNVIEELNAQVKGSPGEFFLVQGIGKGSEKISYGLATLSAAGGLRPMAGDLLVIDPPPGHLLFKEYEQTR